MEYIAAKFNKETIACPTCGGTGNTTEWRDVSHNSTANSFSVCKCRSCKGTGKLIKITIFIELYEPYKEEK